MIEKEETKVDSSDIVGMWLGRIGKANKYYKDWSDTFRCDTMEEYYYGFQWKDASKAPSYERYVINFVFSTIEIKKPTVLFQDPSFKIKPKPKGVDFDYEQAIRRCNLRENVLNTILSDEDNDIDDEFEMFVCDAFFRFGIMEVGYSANWIENPKAGMPILKSDDSPYTHPDDENNILKQPEVLPMDERVYFKRIPAWRFRVGGVDGHNFNKCSWIGYYDFFRIEDIKANKEFQGIKDLDWAGNRSEDSIRSTSADTDDADKQLANSGDLVKVWTIYDLRKKKKLLILENHSILLLEKKFKKLPIVALKFVQKLRGWYPVPLVFNWKGPQDEINEARQQQRIHRRRGDRKYLYKEGAFEDDGEIDKLENGPDMTFAKVQGDPATAIAPLPLATMDNVTNDSMMVARDDLNIITATSSENRGQADRTTATQANLIDQRSQLRETRARTQVAKVLKRIGRLALLTIQEKFTLPMWIKMSTVSSDQNFIEQGQEITEEWKQITASQLGDEDDLDFSVDISLDTLSPIENAQTKQNYVDFLTLCTQFPQTAFSPTMVRENAYRCGYKNEKVIREMMVMAQIAETQRMAEATGQGSQGTGQPGGIADTRSKQMQTPSTGGIQAQLQGQL
jgi:hypothetical protein